MERIKNEHIKEIMRVKGKPDIIDIIEQKRLQWYGHVKMMPEERIPKLIMDWIPFFISYTLYFWVAKWKTKDSAPNDSKHSLTSIYSKFLPE